MAPHRRLPEQFSWVLSRFFEERLIPNPTPSRIKRLRQKIRARTSSNTHPDLETMSDADSDSDFEPFLEEHDEETKGENLLSSITAARPGCFSAHHHFTTSVLANLEKPVKFRTNLSLRCSAPRQTTKIARPHPTLSNPSPPS